MTNTIAPVRYIHPCHWLYHLAYVRDLSGQEILEQSQAMMSWLTERGCAHVWSTGDQKTRVPSDRSFGSRGNYSDTQYITFSNILYFADLEDMTAFRLRWGIQE